MKTRKDISRIPNGLYCYNWKELPSTENNFKGKINRCPYFEDKNINGVCVPWCDYLECGGISNNHSQEDYKKIRKFYKTKKAMNDDLPLFLLWDLCKECGENIEDYIN
jgi:hypothetical protein